MIKSLLEAPRTTCPAEIFALKDKNRVGVVVCGNPATHHSFCSDHAHIHTLLLAVAAAGYPERQINQYYHVEGGIRAWEDVCLRVPSPGQWFGLNPNQAKWLKQDGRKDRYTQIMEAVV